MDCCRCCCCLVSWVQNAYWCSSSPTKISKKSKIIKGSMHHSTKQKERKKLKQIYDICWCCGIVFARYLSAVSGPYRNQLQYQNLKWKRCIDIATAQAMYIWNEPYQLMSFALKLLTFWSSHKCEDVCAFSCLSFEKQRWSKCVMWGPNRVNT